MEILAVLLLTVFNGLFALSEIGVVSARKPFLEVKARQGDRNAQAALELASNPDTLLSTVQLGITFIGVFLGAFSGSRLADALADFIKPIPSIGVHSEAIALTIVVTGLTLVSLIVGELVPKRLALVNPEAVACAVGRPMQAIARTFGPVISVLNFFSSFLMKFIPLSSSQQAGISTEELQALLTQGEEEGVLEVAERDLIRRTFRFADRTVSSIMTPRPDIMWVDLNVGIDESINEMSESPHSVFPVCDGSIDKLLGVVSLREILERRFRGEPIHLHALVRQPLVVPENMPLLRMVDLFRQSGQKLAVVVDEYGGVDGVVTLLDIIEAVIGELPGQSGEDEPSVTKRDDGSLLIDASLSIEELKDVLNVGELPQEEDGNYATLGGFIMSFLGHVPDVAESFIWNGYRFEVVDKDGQRLDKVLIEKLATQTDELPDEDAGE